MCIYVRNKEVSDIHFIFVIYLREQLHQREKFPHKVCVLISSSPCAGAVPSPQFLSLVPVLLLLQNHSEV